ncbi:MAG TPA: hypothetical protein VFQ85_08495 [Mycobacteriales bacterium]|jgi:hypothetical protein|nr:hypothetical protein [Mycobacteriales bacterium]
MSVEQDLRGALARAAEEAGGERLSGLAVRRLAGARRRRRGAVVGAVALAAVAALLVVPWRPAAPVPKDYAAAGRPRAGGYLRWPARGSLTGPLWVEAATSAWDADREAGTGHTEVRVLYGQDDVAVVTGLDGRGRRRVALLRVFARSEFAVMEDRPAPDPRRTVAMAFVLRSYDRRRLGVVVVAEPGLAVITWSARGAGAGVVATGDGAGYVATALADVTVTGYDTGRHVRWRIVPRPAAAGADCPPPGCGAPAVAPPTVPWPRGAENEYETHARALEAAFLRLRERPQPYAITPVQQWFGVFVDVLRIGSGKPRLVVTSDDRHGPRVYTTEYLNRSLDQLPGVAVRIENGTRVLVIPNPRVTEVEYAPDGRHFARLVHSTGFAQHRVSPAAPPGVVRLRMDGRTYLLPVLTGT